MLSSNSIEFRTSLIIESRCEFEASENELILFPRSLKEAKYWLSLLNR